MIIMDLRAVEVLTGELRYFYRTESPGNGSRSSSVTDLSKPEAQPLAIDASINALYTLKKKNGRYALYADQARRQHGRRL